MSSNAANIRGQKKDHPQNRRPTKSWLARIAEEISEDSSYMPVKVNDDQIAAIRATQEEENQGGSRTIGDIYPALAG